MKATPRENLIRTLNRQGFEKVPISLSFCPSQIEAFKKRFGHENYESYFNDPGRSVNISLTPSFKGEGHNLFSREELPPNTKVDAWGVAHSPGPKEAFHMTRMHHPLSGERTQEEIAAYPLPVISVGAKESLTQNVEALHKKGLAAIGGMECNVWEIAWYIREMNSLMMDMMDESENAHILLDRITDNSCQRAEIYATAGCDILRLGDDIGMQKSIMMSEETWKIWIKPRLARVIKAAKSKNPSIKIFYHSCGYILPFIEGLIEVGVEILNPIQPECMDFSEVFKIADGRLSFWGTIGTQTTMPFGTPDDVRKEVRKSINLCGEKGGIVIAPTHLVEPEVSWENLEALKEEAEKGLCSLI